MGIYMTERFDERVRWGRGGAAAGADGLQSSQRLLLQGRSYWSLRCAMLLSDGQRPAARATAAACRRTSLARYYAMRCNMAEQALAKIEVGGSAEPVIACETLQVCRHTWSRSWQGGPVAWLPMTHKEHKSRTRAYA